MASLEVDTYHEAGVWVVVSLQQLDDGALTATTLAHKSNGLITFHLLRSLYETMK